MANTVKLYYAQPGLLEVEATVTAVGGDSLAAVLELDQTLFYPEGGGQPCDLGSIGGVAVASVSEKDGHVLHTLAGTFDGCVGDHARLKLDGGRRLDYSQAHSGQHLLSATALRIIGAPTVSAHFGKERCAIDLDIASIPDEDMAEIEDAVERAIAEDHLIRVHLCPPEDPKAFPLRKRPPVGEDQLRIVEIDGIDFTPCCGTHLSSTGKIRLFRILGSEKYKGMTRLYFLAGGRAAEDYRIVSRIAQDMARSLGVSVGELTSAVSRDAARRKALEFSNVALIRERAAMEASAAPEARPDGVSPKLAMRRYPDRDAASLMETAKAFTSAGMTALLAALPELTVQVLSPNGDLRLAERLKAPLASAGGKGGGGAASFRAVMPDAVSLESLMVAAEQALKGGPA